MNANKYMWLAIILIFFFLVCESHERVRFQGNTEDEFLRIRGLVRESNKTNMGYINTLEQKIPNVMPSCIVGKRFSITSTR